jgi:hypothetical protein
MKRLILLLALIGLVGCGKNTLGPIPVQSDDGQVVTSQCVNTKPVTLVMEYVVNTLEAQPYLISTQTKDYIYNVGGGIPADESTVVTALKDLINAATDEIFAATLGGVYPHQTLILTAKISGGTFDSEPSANMTETILSSNDEVKKVKKDHKKKPKHHKRSNLKERGGLR